MAEAQYYCRLMDHEYLVLGEAERFMRTSNLSNLNGKVYSEIMDALTGRNAVHASTIRTHVLIGDGLSAVLQLSLIHI